MPSAYIAFKQKDNTIKCVYVRNEGALELLGNELNEFFRDEEEVKDLIKTSMFYIENGESHYVNDISPDEDEDECEFEEYLSEDEYIDDFCPNVYYYLYKDNTWFISKPNLNEFKELEIVLEEEY